MTEAAPEHAAALQHIGDLTAPEAVAHGRIVQEAELPRLPRRLEGGLKTHQFPAEDLLVVPAGLCLVIEPSPGAAEGDAAVKGAVVMDELNGIYAYLAEKRLDLGSSGKPVKLSGFYKVSFEKGELGSPSQASVIQYTWQ